MKDYIFGNLTDWGSTLEKLQDLMERGELDNHQDELIRLLRFDDNWRLREAAVDATSSLTIPQIDTVRQIAKLIQRDDLYYNIRIMAAEALLNLIPLIIKNNGKDNEVVRFFINETSLEMTRLLSSPEPPIFHDALEVVFDQIQKFVEVTA